jgi:hypothetical protein
MTRFPAFIAAQVERVLILQVRTRTTEEKS